MKLFHTFISQEAKDNVLRVLDGGWPGMGVETELFESEFAAYIGAKYAIATNSGTEALRLATHIASRKTKHGYAVTTPNTFIASNVVLVQNDMHPIFTDIEYSTGNMKIEDVELALQSYNCGLIMLVHYGGMPADIASFENLAARYRVELIHDCAHACGAIYGGEKVGKDVKYACYSFHAVKNLPIGDGGMLVTNDDEVALLARQLRWFGIDKSTYQRFQGTYSWEYDVIDFGYKGHMWDVQAAIGRGQLPYVDQWNAKKAILVDRYRKNFHSCGFPRPLNRPTYNSQSSNYLFVVQFENKDSRHKVAEALNKEGIQAGMHYKPNYLYKNYSDFPIIGTKNMEKFYETALTLPLHLGLVEADIDKVCDIIQESLCVWL